MINSWLGKYLRYFPTAGAIAAVPYVFIKGLKMNKRTEKYISKIRSITINHFSEIFFNGYDHEAKIQLEKQHKFSYIETIQRLIQFNENHFHYDLTNFTFGDSIQLYLKLVDRIKTLRQNNKHQSIIDISLYEIFAKNYEDAKRAYAEMVYNKTRLWIECDASKRDSKSINYFIKKYGKELAEQKRKESFESSKKNRNNTLEYYLTRGYSIEESKDLLRERQSTFTLEKCIKRYGETDGRIIWLERQTKWLNTLNSKSQEEKDRINVLKGCNGNDRYKNDNDALFYVIRLCDGTHKIGITIKDRIDKRYSDRSLQNHTVLVIFKQKAYLVEKVELIFKLSHSENVIASSDHKFKNFGRSETFKDLTSDYIIETIDKIFELYLNN